MAILDVAMIPVPIITNRVQRISMAALFADKALGQCLPLFWRQKVHHFAQSIFPYCSL